MSVLTTLSTVLAVAAAVLCVPAAMLLIELVAARLALHRDERGAGSSSAQTSRGSVAVLVPAHDEAGGIAATLASVQSQLRQGDHLLVVADNCTDQTAAVARVAGADVVERHDPLLRGKGYALDFGVRHLAAVTPQTPAGPPQVILILDADCQVQEGAVDALVASCLQNGRPAQACYLMHHPVEARTLGARIAEFAFIVKNRLRPLGLATLGWPCPLFGSGMAFPFALIVDAPLANGHLVEDMKLGVDLSARGLGPVFVPHALVTSAFPTSEQGRRTQRTRWEHGHLQTIATQMPALWLSGLRRGDRGAVALAIDLAIPPLALLVMMTTAVALLGFGTWLLGGSSLPAVLGLVALMMLGTAVMLAWFAVGCELLPFSMLRQVPGYILAKLPLYRDFFGARQTAWVRSRRDHEHGADIDEH